MKRSPNYKFVVGILFLTLALQLSCAPTYRRQEDIPEVKRALVSYLHEVDAYESGGFIKKAIEVAELGLIDHYYSNQLRDRLAALRSQRQVQYQADLRQANLALETGDTEAAKAIFKEIEKYGDSFMIKQVRAKQDLLSEPKPAIYSDEH